MARNRRYESAAVRFGPALKAFLLCVLIGGSAVGYVWQKNQIFELGRQKKARELRLEQLTAYNEKLRKHLSGMRSPEILEKEIRERNLGLGPPAPAQVWRLPEQVRELPRATAERQYVARDEHAPGTP